MPSSGAPINHPKEPVENFSSHQQLFGVGRRLHLKLYRQQLAQQSKDIDKPARQEFCIDMLEKFKDGGFGDFSDEEDLLKWQNLQA